jgi:hypothetical protein
LLKLLPVLCECVQLVGGRMLFYPDFHEVKGLGLGAWGLGLGTES